MRVVSSCNGSRLSVDGFTDRSRQAERSKSRVGAWICGRCLAFVVGLRGALSSGGSTLDAFVRLVGAAAVIESISWCGVLYELPAMPIDHGSLLLGRGSVFGPLLVLALYLVSGYQMVCTGRWAWALFALASCNSLMAAYSWCSQGEDWMMSAALVMVVAAGLMGSAHFDWSRWCWRIYAGLGYGQCVLQKGEHIQWYDGAAMVYVLNSPRWCSLWSLGLGSVHWVALAGCAFTLVLESFIAASYVLGWRVSLGRRAVLLLHVSTGLLMPLGGFPWVMALCYGAGVAAAPFPSVVPARLGRAVCNWAAEDLRGRLRPLRSAVAAQARARGSVRDTASC